VTTTAANSIVVYVGGADWLSTQSTIVFTQPADYTGLAAFTDEGNEDFWWSSLMVAWAYAPTMGPTGPITGELNCTEVRGLPWTIAVGVAPK
jgi:hypothetical protein